MSDTDWLWSVSSIAPHKLLIWLEPWAEEFEVPAGSAIELRFAGGLPGDHPVEIESAADQVVIWASAGQTVIVSIDGAVQHSASASIPVPRADHLSTRQFLGIMLGAQPVDAPQAGSAEPRRGWWQRIKDYLRHNREVGPGSSPG